MVWSYEMNEKEQNTKKVFFLDMVSEKKDKDRMEWKKVKVIMEKMLPRARLE